MYSAKVTTKSLVHHPSPSCMTRSMRIEEGYIYEIISRQGTNTNSTFSACFLVCLFVCLLLSTMSSYYITKCDLNYVPNFCQKIYAYCQTKLCLDHTKKNLFSSTLYQSISISISPFKKYEWFNLNIPIPYFELLYIQRQRLVFVITLRMSSNFHYIVFSWEPTIFEEISGKLTPGY